MPTRTPSPRKRTKKFLEDAQGRRLKGGRMKTKGTANAIEIFDREFVQGDPKRLAALERARVQAAIARAVYQLRTEAGLTQEQLAQLIGTTQSVVSRVEDEEYQGRSLDVLRRVAEALEFRVTVVMEPRTRRAKGRRPLRVRLGE